MWRNSEPANRQKGPSACLTILGISESSPHPQYDTTLHMREVLACTHLTIFW